MSTPIGKKIRNIREAMELGRQAFAEKTGIPKDTVIGIETGRHLPGANALIAIAQAWPQYATYLLIDEIDVKQKNPEVESLAKELPKAKKAN